MELRLHEDSLSGCRFCPMCKPASEVGKIRPFESNSTRARAMLLWRIAKGYEEWTPRSAELLYQATLDGISESWCVANRPVTQYQLAGRRDVWTAGMAPDPVRSAADHHMESVVHGERGVVLFAGEFADMDDIEGAESAANLLGTGVVFTLSGATAYCLGALENARHQAEDASLLVAGADMIVTDGPQTQWMLEKIWPEFGIDVSAEIVSPSDRILSRLDEAAVTPADRSGYRSVFLDSRASSYVASRSASSRAIQPGFSGPEDDLGLGDSFESPRTLMERLEMDRVFDRWSRSLARSCGSDDGLWATYPDIADDLARETISRAKELGATSVVVDSPIAARLLRSVSGAPIAIDWVGDLVESAGI